MQETALAVDRLGGKGRRCAANGKHKSDSATLHKPLHQQLIWGPLCFHRLMDMKVCKGGNAQNKGGPQKLYMKGAIDPEPP